MPGAYPCQKQTQHIKGGKASAELGTQHKVAQKSLVHAEKQKIVPRRQVHHAVRTARTGRIFQRRRLAAVRAETGLSAPDLRSAPGAEKKGGRLLRGRHGMSRQRIRFKRLTAGHTAPFPEPQSGKKPARALSPPCRKRPCPLHAGSPPKPFAYSRMRSRASALFSSASGPSSP